MDTKATSDALSYYRSQCDELGARVLRLQQELVQARRDAQRNRTLALVVEQIHGFARDADADADAEGAFAEHLGEQLLMLLIERLQVETAALLYQDGDSSSYRIAQAVGMPTTAPLKLAGAAPTSNMLLAADHPLPRQTGLHVGLWVGAPPSPWSLLLGFRRQARAGRQGLDPADRLIAEAAIRIYDGLLSRQQALRAQRDSEANYKALFESAQDAILVLDLGGRQVLDANRRATDLFGGTLQHLQARLASVLPLPAESQAWRKAWRLALRGRAQRIEAQLRRADERTLWTEVNLKRIDTQPPILLAMIRDISARKATEQEMQRLQERLDLALEGAGVGLYDVNLESGDIIYDDRYVRILGGDRERVPRNALQWRASIHPDDLPTIERIAEEVRLGKRDRVELEYRVRHQSGDWVWLLDRGKVFERDANGQPRRAAGTCLDISERKRSEASIHRLAFFDPLTDLPNRRLFLDRLANAQSTAQRTGQIGAVLFLDLDRFKQINDARGHEVGDQLLQQVSERLRRLLRDEDTVARFGGDEFVVLLHNLASGEDEASHFAHRVAEKIRLALSASYALRVGELRSEVSIGITLVRGHEASVQDLVREADTALYRAKESGRNCIRFFEPSMQDAAEARFIMEGELRQAIERRELRLHYQPQVDASGHLIGVEALMRWPHADKGMISPGQFIPVAEDTSLILPMGRWALNEACRFLARLQSAGRGLRMSVNVSPRQFRQADFIDQVRLALERSGVAPQHLTLELTESVVIEDIAATIRTMRELKALGLRFSIDDFGTGYSSLTYLKRLPVDELKIDRAFVQDVCTDADDAALVEAILSVCRHLRMSVIAEGVETAEQLQFFRARQCDAYQGYYFGMPLPGDTLLETLDLETTLPQPSGR